MIKTVLKISILIFWLGFGLHFLSEQSVKFSQAKLTSPDGKSTIVNLPYAVPSTNKGDYLFEIDFEAKKFSTRTFIVWVDDCLEDLRLNGQELSHIGRRCLDPNGLIIDLSKNYRKGKNHLSIKIKERGGKLKLSFKPHANNNTLEIIKILYIAVIAGLVLLISKSFPKYQATINLCLLAFIFRFLFIYSLHPLEEYLFSDMAGHERRAREILDGLANAEVIEKPPGYHYLVTISLWLFNNFDLVKLIHLIASIMTCVLVAKASRHFFGRSGAKIIFAIMAVHIPLIFIGGILMEECLFALCLSWLFLILCKKVNYFKSGVVFSLAFWLKGTHVFYAPLAACWDLVRDRKNYQIVIYNWLKFSMGFLLILFLQLALTRTIYGSAKFPSAGAVNFIEGKCEGDSQTDSNGSYRYSPLFSEIKRERVRSWPFTFQESDKVWQAGWNCIRENPYVLISSLSSIYYLFHGNSHWPFRQTIFYELNAWYGMMYTFFVFPGILFGILRLFKSPKRFMPFLPAFSLFICVWFFKSEIRFRVPFDTIFLPLSALGWASVIKIYFPKNHKKILTYSGIGYVLIVTTAMSSSFLDYLIR